MAANKTVQCFFRMSIGQSACSGKKMSQRSTATRCTHTAAIQLSYGTGAGSPWAASGTGVCDASSASRRYPSRMQRSRGSQRLPRSSSTHLLFSWEPPCQNYKRCLVTNLWMLHSQIVYFVSGQGRSEDESAGVVALHRGILPSENAGLGLKMTHFWASPVDIGQKRGILPVIKACRNHAEPNAV